MFDSIRQQKSVSLIQTINTKPDAVRAANFFLANSESTKHAPISCLAHDESQLVVVLFESLRPTPCYLLLCLIVQFVDVLAISLDYIEVSCNLFPKMRKTG